MGGVDAIAFTGGIGENDANLRKEVCENMEYLGIKFDEEKNKVRGEQKISADDSKVEVWVIPTNEELLIARDTLLHWSVAPSWNLKNKLVTIPLY